MSERIRVRPPVEGSEYIPAQVGANAKYHFMCWKRGYLGVVNYWTRRGEEGKVARLKEAMGNERDVDDLWLFVPDPPFDITGEDPEDNPRSDAPKEPEPTAPAMRGRVAPVRDCFGARSVELDRRRRERQAEIRLRSKARRRTTP